MTLNPFKPMNLKSRTLFLSLQLAVFVAAYILSVTTLKDIYVPNWTARNLYLFVWAFVVFLTLFRKPIIAAAITLGNVFGIVVGQGLDGVTQQGAPDYESYGWLIWLCTILAFLTVGIVLSGRNVSKAFLNLNPFKPMNIESRMMFMLAQLGVFFATYSLYFMLETLGLGKTFMYITPIAFILTLIKLPTISAALTIGNIFGLFIGTMLGEFMWIAWIVIELLFLAAGILVSRRWGQR
ncbi:hypothetical protein FACS1894217_10300 [Clostridia bacterium]|nr:hypothetical protein FACS1894217_10300 [Clostridia bacterium]